MRFDQHANMKYRNGNREFWCRGYYVDTVGKKKKAIAEYIRNQLQEDVAYEQMRIKELVDPSTGEPVKEAKNSQPLLVVVRLADDSVGFQPRQYYALIGLSKPPV